MPESLVQLYTHLVFSTKDRVPHLTDANHQASLYKYVRGILNNLDSPVVEIGGTADHIHILCRLSSGIAVKNLMGELKRDTSKFVKTLSPELASFYWQGGYGAFSISPYHVPKLVNYIRNQEEHHKTETFQDEFRRLLKKFKIEFDERYVWD